MCVFCVRSVSRGNIQKKRQQLAPRALRAALAAETARAEAAESELVQVRATVSCSEAMIKELKLEIAKLRRDKYGVSSERGKRLLDQLELQLEELEAAATIIGEDDEFAKGVRILNRALVWHEGSGIANEADQARWAKLITDVAGRTLLALRSA